MAAVLRKCIAASRLGFLRRGLGLPATKKWSFSSTLYSSEASRGVLRCVQEELKLEQRTMDNLPSVTGYNTTVTGSQAILQCIRGNDKVKVELDTNSAVEVSSDEADDDSEPFFAPAFTVTVTKPSGNRLQFECSFEEYGDYHLQGNEYQSMCLDSVSVISANTQEVDTIYTALSGNLSEELYGSLMDYLKDCGIDKRFASEILKFYKTFEHTCYVEQFLKGLEDVIQN